jgi:segregation and condensation protein A
MDAQLRDPARIAGNVGADPPAGGEDLFVVDLERFHGPLDLLLHLIRKQDIDVFDIPIARITHQFLAALRAVERLEIDRAGEFLEMAAVLLRIKAQMLFPRRGDAEEEDPRADLVRRLLEYEHFRSAAQRLEVAERERARVHAKGFVEVRPRPDLAEAPLETRWDDVWGALHGLLERLARPLPEVRMSGPIVRIEEKIQLVMNALRKLKRVEFSRIVQPWGTRRHAVASLLACLELSKRSELRLRQSGPFKPIWIYRGEGGG